MVMGLGNLTLHQLFDWAGAIVLVSSILGSFLPPYEWFDNWPKFQAVYKVFVMTVTKWGAINLKSVVYPSVNVQSQAQSLSGQTPLPGQLK
jgi:hypothetical protein